MAERSVTKCAVYAILAGCCLATESRAAGALQSSRPEYHGLVASVTANRVGLEIADAGRVTREFAMTFSAGYRVRVASLGKTRLSITPQLALMVTHVGGIDEGSADVATASIDRGLQLALRAGGIRPYALWRRGKHTVERSEGGEAFNYYGTGTTWGVGLEIPRAVRGHGLDIVVLKRSGVFTVLERREVEVEAALRHKTIIVGVGWSGTLRGTRPLGF